MASTDDIVAIQQLIGLYGHIIDERQWERVGELFTDDVIYDVTDIGRGIWTGVETVRDHWATGDKHPLAHHATNIVVMEDAGDGLLAMSKGIGVGHGGRVGSVTYRYTLRRTASGWRISHMAAVLRRTPARAARA
jgi:ketosteroid isomerase-like protein